DKSVGAEAMATPLKLAPPRARPVAALYVAAEVARELPRLLPREVAEAPGLDVFTSIDADAQREAERATRHGLAALERGRRRRAPLEAALVALDPPTGRVRALAGGRGPRHRRAAAARAGPRARRGGDLAPRADRGLRRVRERRRAPAPEARRGRHLRRRRDPLRRPARGGARPRPGRRLSRHPSP